MALETVKLEGVLNIARAEMLHQQLESYVTNATPVQIDAGDVSRVDTAIVQLFVVFFKGMSANSVDVKWISLSEEFLTAIKLLGMQHELHVND